MKYILLNYIDENSCQKEFSLTSVIVGIIIIFGIFLTYIPQYYKIIKDKSSKGISSNYILLYNITNFTNFYGTLLINFYLVNCCISVSNKKCFNLIIPIFQMFTPWAAVFILYIIFLIYDEKSNYYGFKSYPIISFLLFVIFFIFILGFIGMGFLLEFPKYQENIKIFGDFLNIISTITCIFCLLPQIYQIYKQKNIGNLSLLSILMQAPGSLLVFIYQFNILKAPFSIGMPYLFSFIFQTILLIEGYYYNNIYQKRNVVLINSYD